jgi:hypothetical protein
MGFSWKHKYRQNRWCYFTTGLATTDELDAKQDQ